MDNYGNGYNYNDGYNGGYGDGGFGGFGSSEPVVLTLIKGIIGACIGVIPGMLLWIIAGKIGFVFSAIGILIAAGAVFGFGLMASKGDISPVIGLVICAVIFLLAIYVSVRIVWTWDMASALKDIMSTYRQDMIEWAMGMDSSITYSDAAQVVTEEYAMENFREYYGVSDATFGQCFTHFGDLLEIAESKGDYIWDLVKAEFFGLVGGLAIFAKKK